MKLRELIEKLQRFDIHEKDDIEVELFVTGNGSSIYLQGMDLDGQKLVQISDEEF